MEGLTKASRQKYEAQQRKRGAAAKPKPSAKQPRRDTEQRPTSARPAYGRPSGKTASQSASSQRPTATREGYEAARQHRATSTRPTASRATTGRSSGRPTATRQSYAAQGVRKPQGAIFGGGATHTPAKSFRHAGAAISGILSRPKANPLTEWKAATRGAKRQMHAAHRAEATIATAHRQAEQAAAKARPRRPPEIGALFDGKEILNGTGGIVGRWRYRGGSFQADYFP